MMMEVVCQSLNNNMNPSISRFKGHTLTHFKKQLKIIYVQSHRDSYLSPSPNLCLECLLLQQCWFLHVYNLWQLKACVCVYVSVNWLKELTIYWFTAKYLLTVTNIVVNTILYYIFNIFRKCIEATTVNYISMHTDISEIVWM